MHIPIPPTGGQSGSHYGKNPPPPPKIYFEHSSVPGRDQVPRRFRDIRLRRRRGRRRGMRDTSPALTFFVIVFVVLPIFLLLLSRFVHVVSIITPTVL